MLKTLGFYIARIDKNVTCLLFLACFLFLNLPSTHAEGSKDLYPINAQGARASMYSTSTIQPLSSFPFKTKGTHYVYAEVGEWICAASSAQGMGVGKVILTAPDGQSFQSTVGRIENRAQELAGPLRPNDLSNGSYQPYAHQVASGQAGVWRVDFIPPREHDESMSGPQAQGLYATENWTQRNEYFIVAWDISVRNSANSNWINGRVYANVLNLGIQGYFSDPNRGYYGKNYVLTKDGRAYYVQNNGNNGFGFTFFANNKGFIDASGNALYKSLNASGSGIGSRVHDPRKVDDDAKNLITHKLFYNPPDFNLPEEAPIWVDGQQNSKTWLRQKATIPAVKNVSFVGSEGTPNQAGLKGGYINFESNVPGTYRIVIPVNGGTDRVLIGTAVKNQNSIKWDGKDGAGAPFPPSSTIPEVRIQLTSAEVHFPFLDMEINPNGIIIELTENLEGYTLNRNSTDESVYNDRVYWDDTDINPGAPGESSNPIKNTSGGSHSYANGSSAANGHKWGTYSENSGGGNSGKGGSSFGNDKAMDTWSYILSRDAAIRLNIEIKVADLKIVSIIPETTGQGTGSQITYRVKVKNEGPSAVSAAKFGLEIPAGMNVTGISFVSPGCGQETKREQNGQFFLSELNLSSGCEVEYVVTGTVAAASLHGFNFEANIMRPYDVTDPDASNQVFDKVPADPHEECRNGTGTEACNNIKYNSIRALEFCEGSPINPFFYNFSSGGSNYTTVNDLPTWLTATVTGGRVTFTGIPTADGLFAITIGTAGNDRQKTTFFIKVNPQPKITNQPVNSSICEGDAAVFSVTSVETTDTYQWQFDDNGVWRNFVNGGIVTGARTSTLKISDVPVSYHNKKIRVVLLSRFGCQKLSNEIVLTVNERPNVSTIVGNSKLCFGGSVELKSSFAGAASYQWYFNGNIITGATQQSYNAGNAGKYSVTVGNGSGCFSKKSAEFDVAVVPLPGVPDITYGQLTFCSGGTVVLTSSAAANNQWYKNGEEIAGATGKTYTTGESGTYTVKVTNANGCSATSASVEVIVNALPPAPGIIVDADKLTFCLGGTVTLTSSAAVNNQWYKNGQEIIGATGKTYTTGDAGTYTIKVTNANGCSATSASVEVIVNALPPVPGIIVDSDKLTFCAGGSVTLTSSSAVNNQWYKNGQEIAGATAKTYTTGEAGTYTVKVTNANGCSVTSASAEVIVNALPPMPGIIVDTDKLTFCAGGSVTLTSSAALNNQWYKNGQEIVGATGKTYTTGEAGTYTVKVTNSNGCSVTSASAEVIVNALPPAPGIIVDTDKLTFCAGGSVTLTSSAALNNQWYKNGQEIVGATGKTYTTGEAGIYTVKVTNSNGCSVTSASAEVIVNALPPVPGIIVDTDKLTFCAGGSVTLTSSAALNNQWYKNGQEIIGATGKTYTTGEAGIYTVKVTNSNGCSATSASAEVIVNALPPAPGIIVDTDKLTFCSGGTVTLTSSAAVNNQWYKNGQEIVGATGKTYTTGDAGTYTVKVTNANGCSATSASVEVVVNALPPAPGIIVDADKLTFCTGSSVTLTSSSAVNNQWYKNGQEIIGATGKTYTTGEAGTYTVKVTNANGCSATSASVEVIVNALPPAPGIIVDTDKLTFCSGGTVTLTSSAAVNNQWYKNGQEIIGATGKTYTTGEAGTYTVKVTNANGCSATSASVAVIVNALPPAPGIIVDADKLTFCSGGSVTLTSSAAVNNQWYKNGQEIVGATGKTYTTGDAGTYTVKVTNANGCSATSASVEVIVNALPPAPGIIVDTDKLTFCVGGSVTLTSSSAVNNQWYKNDQIINGATGKTYTTGDAGTYTVKVTNANGCSATSASVEVVVNALPPAPGIIVDTDKLTFCVGGSVTLTSSSAVNNQWYKNDQIINGATGKTYTTGEAGTYTVKVTNANGCSATSASVEVVVNALPPAPGIIVDTDKLTFCVGGSVTLTSSSAVNNQWYKNDQIINGATGKTYTTGDAGTYTVKVTNANGCSATSASVEVIVNALPPAPGIIVDADKLTFCSGGTVTLTSSAAVNNQWYKNGQEIIGATGKTYTTGDAGTYTVKVTNANGCSATSASVEVIVNALPPAPGIIVDADKLTFCSGGSVTLTSSSAVNNQWYKNGQEIIGATGKTYTTGDAGTYTVKVTNANGCSATSASVEVIVNALPPAPGIIVDTDKLTFCSGGSVTLTSSSAVNNQWYKNGQEIVGATGKTYTTGEAGTYTVKVTNANGCSATSASVEVVVNALPAAPGIIVDTDKLTFCSGGTVTLTSSAAAVNNQWYKNGQEIIGATGKTYTTGDAGTYTVKVTNSNGCSATSASVEVVVNALPPAPGIIVDSNKLTFCEGGSVTLTSSSAVNNQWYKDGQIINGATGKTYITSESGTYTVRVTNVNGCSSFPSASIQVKVSPFPTKPNISPGGITQFCEGGKVVLTSSSANGNQWYKNGNLILGATRQTLDVSEIGNYSVKVTNETGCASPISATTVVTVNRIPKGFDDSINSLSCNQSSFSYDLQTNNINNIGKGGNSIPASFTWTVNSTVLGATNGSGKIINATLINTSTVEQYVVYLVTPKAENGGCEGKPFKITVRVPVCLNISIGKTANRNSVSAVGDKIKYTITVHNNGNANHTAVKVNDPMLGGMLYQPKGDNGNGILEKNESWYYEGIYTISQEDLDRNGFPTSGTGKIINIATVSSLEYPLSKSASAEVAVITNPSIRLVKKGALNRDFRTITYTFIITNRGNVTLSKLILTDPKIPGPIVLKQTTLAPGESTTVNAEYTITEAEKIAGKISNTAKVSGFTRQNLEVKDISGTAENNDEHTLTDITRYPIAIDDYAKTNAEVEVAVPIVINDRPALFPLDVTTIEVKTQAANGRLTITKEGKVLYKPNKGYFGPERFTYKINDANGLSSNIAVVKIDVIPPPLNIPNTFTPNGDGKNDTFNIVGLENYDNVSFFVYNRWGDEVYRNTNYKNDWDGKGLNDGTYFYVLKLKKGTIEESRRSWVLLKR